MEIDILNPKAEQLLKILAELDLIAIHDDSKSAFEKNLQKLRPKAESTPSLDELTKEVESPDITSAASCL